MKPLHGKIALVTGVGRRQGIGYAVCKKLALLGADVFYTYWHAYDKEGNLIGGQADPAVYASEFAEFNVRAVCTEMDLGDSRTPPLLFERVIRELGIPDILINNACVSTAQPFLEVNAELLDAHYAVNMRAPVLLCKEFAAHFKKETGGRIVNMTSGQALGVMANELPYTITKAGLEMLTLQLSFELREKGITINAVDPGPTDTGWMSDEIKKIILAESKIGRINTPEDAAALVVSFIHGDKEAVTGSVLHAER